MQAFNAVSVYLALQWQENDEVGNVTFKCNFSHSLLSCWGWRHLRISGGGGPGSVTQTPLMLPIGHQKFSPAFPNLMLPSVVNCLASLAFGVWRAVN